MRVSTSLLTALLVALALGGLASANVAPYSGSSSSCVLQTPAGALPQPVMGCSVAHAGTLSVTVADCTATRCSVRAGGTLTGTSTLPATLFADSFLQLPGEGGNLICSVSEVGTGASCSGTSDPVSFAVAPGGCAAFSVASRVLAFSTQLTYFTASLNEPHRICRDAAGVPEVF